MAHVVVEWPQDPRPQCKKSIFPQKLCFSKGALFKFGSSKFIYCENAQKFDKKSSTLFCRFWVKLNFFFQSMWPSHNIWTLCIYFYKLGKNSSINTLWLWFSTLVRYFVWVFSIFFLCMTRREILSVFKAFDRKKRRALQNRLLAKNIFTVNNLLTGSENKFRFYEFWRIL